MTHLKPEDWRKKHKANSGKPKKNQAPDMGTYKNNFPVSFMTFDKLLAEAKNIKNKTKVPYLGKEERFKDPKKSKSSNTGAPGAGQYNMLIDWPGKRAASLFPPHFRTAQGGFPPISGQPLAFQGRWKSETDL